MAGEVYLVAREEAREVLAVPTPLTRVPASKGWLLGLANVRGQLLPIIDLRAYFGAGVTPPSRAARIVVVNHREVTAEVPPTIVNCGRHMAGSFRRSSEQWPVLALRSLVEDSAFLEASA